MAGEVEFLDLDPVKVGKDVNWRTDPYRNRSWSMVFHSLRWMGRLVADYENNGRQAYLDRATEIAKDWVAGQPPRQRQGQSVRLAGAPDRAARPRAGLPQQARQRVLADRQPGRAREDALQPEAVREGPQPRHRPGHRAARHRLPLQARRMVQPRDQAADRDREARRRLPGRAARAGPALRDLRPRAPQGRDGQHHGVRPEGARARSPNGGSRWRASSPTPPSPTGSWSRSATAPRTCGRPVTTRP